LRFFDPSNESELTRLIHRAPPVLGEHAAAVLAWLDAADAQDTANP
jgi:hypothetical protein